MILPLAPGLAGIISRITPEDGAIDGQLRDDWLDICQRAADWYEVRRQDVSRPFSAEHLLHEAIAYRHGILDQMRLNEKPEGTGNDG